MKKQTLLQLAVLAFCSVLLAEEVREDTSKWTSDYVISDSRTYVFETVDDGTAYGIVVNGGSPTLVVEKSVSISMSGRDFPCIKISGNADATLKLEDEAVAYLSCNSNAATCPTLEIASGSSLTIDSAAQSTLSILPAFNRISTELVHN